MHKAGIAAMLALAACTPVAQDPALPLVRAELAPDAAVDVAGEARIPVRAVTRAGSAVAADCVAEGAGFRATFTAPALVAVPSYGPASPPVTVLCAAGALAGARVAQPSARRANGLAGWPAIGVGIGSGSGGGTSVSVGGFWNGGWGTGPQTYAVTYPAVDVVLE